MYSKTFDWTRAGTVYYPKLPKAEQVTVTSERKHPIGFVKEPNASLFVPTVYRTRSTHGRRPRG